MAPTALQDGVDGILNDTQSLRPTAITYSDSSPDSDKMEPIAVVGFSFKFPQEATTPDAFWQVLREKRCAMTEWPRDRLNIDAFYHPDSKRLDTVQNPTTSLVISC